MGILHSAAAPIDNVGILIVVGGPQYRVGSHRLFVQMARRWAAAGFPVLRFDYRGMGDSAGARRAFDSIGEDIQAAVDTMMRELPVLKGVVIFGLCDAAAAALMYGVHDARVRGLILANPWVRTPAGEARSFVRHYYGARLLQASFWKKVLTGEFRLVRSLWQFVGSLRLARGRSHTSGGESDRAFIDRMLVGLEGSSWPVLILISENDLTATEFTDLCADDTAWRAASSQPNVTHQLIGGADHTLASRRALDDALRLSTQWLATQVRHQA